MSLLKPVTLTMVLVVLLVHEMKEASTQISGTFSDLMVYQEDASDSAGTILSGVLLSGLRDCRHALRRNDGPASPCTRAAAT